MAVTVPAPPYKTPLLDVNGLLTPSWTAWFRDLYKRVGGTIAFSNTELYAAADVTDLTANVATIQTQVNTNTGDIQDLQVSVGSSGVGVGRQL